MSAPSAADGDPVAPPSPSAGDPVPGEDEPPAVAADGSTFSVRPLDDVAEVHAASAVLGQVWGGDNAGMPPNLMRALAHADNYVVGLYADDRLIGASVAFFGPPAERTMHSHITGVLPEYQGQGLGRVLKNHQRDWAFARGVGTVTWTFDPLVARNAHFNLCVLGARVTDYLVNQYGAMDDGINRGDETDRVMVAWVMAARPVPAPDDADVVAAVAIPEDIQSVRRGAPSDAADWRRRVRDAFAANLADGLVVGGFDDTRGYLFVRP